MYIMGLTDDYAAAVNFTKNIDFSESHTSDSISLFETTIRYLGGMLSAYELSGKTDYGLITKAVELGDKLAFAWVGNNTRTFEISYGDSCRSYFLFDWRRVVDQIMHGISAYLNSLKFVSSLQYSQL